jgi:hypothetical protein
LAPFKPSHHGACGYFAWPTNKIAITEELRASANQVLTLDNSLYAVAQDLSEQKIKRYGTHLTESADQLREIYRKQKHIAPLREYDEYLIGNELPLQKQLEALVPKTSPLSRWINEIK